MREGWRRWILATAAVLVAVVAFVATRGGGAVEPSRPPAPVSAVEACKLPATAGKGATATAASWKLEVREDTPENSVLLFISGNAALLCEASRAADGNFGASSLTTEGYFQPAGAHLLTWDSGSEGPGEQLVIGQMPDTTASVEIVTADGESRWATLGRDFYLAYVATSNSPSPITAIVARNGAGVELARLASDAGLRPGAETSAAGSVPVAPPVTPSPAPSASL